MLALVVGFASRINPCGVRGPAMCVVAAGRAGYDAYLIDRLMMNEERGQDAVICTV
jgi:hypothetical protein